MTRESTVEPGDPASSGNKTGALGVWSAMLKVSFIAVITAVWLARPGLAPAAEAHKASVQTRREDEGKKTGPKHDGEVKAGQPFEIALEVDKDFTDCVNFVIDAALLDEAGKTVWKKKISQRQQCDD